MINSVRHLTEVNGKKVLSKRPLDLEGNVDWPEFDRQREEAPIFFDHETDMISCKMLTKPVNEGGNENLCQWSDLVTIGLEQLKYFNNKFPCEDNEQAINAIKTGLAWNDKRTTDRVKRNVEGKDIK
jgi:hypothetical protein